MNCNHVTTYDLVCINAAALHCNCARQILRSKPSYRQPSFVPHSSFTHAVVVIIIVTVLVQLLLNVSWSVRNNDAVLLLGVQLAALR